jgi:hypothetical protein
MRGVVGVRDRGLDPERGDQERECPGRSLSRTTTRLGWLLKRELSARALSAELAPGQFMDELVAK